MAQLLFAGRCSTYAVVLAVVTQIAVTGGSEWAALATPVRDALTFVVTP